jgi:hypothetical protein
MSGAMSVADFARQVGVKPRIISDLIYDQRLPQARLQKIGGRWIFPADFVAEAETLVRSLARRKAGREQPKELVP